MLNNDKLRRLGRFPPAGESASGMLMRPVSHVIVFVLGFMLAKTPLVGLYPFAAALISAVGREYIFTSALGAAAACIFPPDESVLHILAAALAACAVRRTLSELRTLNSKPLYPAAAAFFSSASGRFIAAVHYGGTAWTYTVSALCEAMFSAACAFFFSRCFAVMGSVYNEGGASFRARRIAALPAELSIKQKGACLFTVCVLLVPLCRITAGGFSPFSVLVLFASVLAARSLSPSSACVLGVAGGAVLSAAYGDIAYAGICSAAALMSSLFAPLSGILCACVYSSVCIGASLSLGSIDVYFIIESLLAAGAAAAVPKSLLASAERFRSDRPPADGRSVIASPGDMPSVQVCREEPDRAFTDPGGLYFTARKLRAAAEGLSEMSEQVLEVSSRLDKLDAEDSLCLSGMPDPCSGCGISASCWGELSSETGESIRAIYEKIDGGKPVSDILSGRCPRWGELVAALEKNHREHAEKERIRRRISHIRTAVSCQFECVADLLSGLAGDISPRGRPDGDGEYISPEDRKLVFSVFDRFGFGPGDIYADFGRNGRFTASLGAETARNGYLPDMVQALSDTLGWPLETDEDREGEITIRRKTPLRAAFGTCQAAKRGSRLCGDSCCAVLLDGGSAAIILSDGMGSGGRAAIDAAMTCGLMKRLLIAGFDVRGAMGMVNSALMLRAEDEPLATVDCVMIDLFTGGTVIEKAGAAASFIKHCGKISTVCPESLPLGIMDSVDSSRTEFALDAGDVILIVSDGVIGDGSCGWIEEMLADSAADRDMRELASDVVGKAGLACDDDLTAVAVRIQNAGQA